MISGFVNAYSEAIVELVVRGPNPREQKIEGVVDTGFNGSLSLPPGIIALLDLPFRRRGRAVLADGSETIFDIYEAIVIWDGQARRVAVDEADADPLIGMAILHGFTLKMEVVNGGSVIIEDIPENV